MQNDEKFAKEVAHGVVDFLEKKNKKNLLGRVVELLQENADTEKVTVLTPRALKAEERMKVKKFVGKVVGKNVNNIVFVKDETLLDGIRIESKQKIWDFSLSSQVNRFRGN